MPFKNYKVYNSGYKRVDENSNIRKVDSKVKSHPAMLEYYFKYNRIPDVYSNLNSNVRSASKDIKLYDKEFVEFDTIIIGTDIKFRQKIEIIRNLKDCEIVNWLDSF